MSQSHYDLILIARSPEGPLVDMHVLTQAMAEVVSRLDDVKLLLWTGDSEPLKDWIVAHSPPSRIVVIPLSLFQMGISELRTGLWFAGLSTSIAIFLSEPLTAIEVGNWIGNSTRRSLEPSCVELIPPSVPDPAIIDRLAAVAYWVGEAGTCWIRGDQRYLHRTVPLACKHYLAFTATSYAMTDGRIAHGPMIQSGDAIVPWDWLPADTLASWTIGRYLQALNTHPISFSDQSEEELLHRYLKSLADHQYSILPKDYGGKLDSVTPSSMGSASLVYDAQGKVPWDTIWTSFCDLAMAGGPPHRGTLLSNVSGEEIERQREQYDLVVSELRRGIELASKLPTCESKSPGWVGVCCHDERMAAWMLRAIIVENILVRREGSVLYLPAGPEFRIEKEIKNVITAVAKTTHYWFGHLKVRQPPKPL